MSFADPAGVLDRLTCNSIETPGPLATPCWVWAKGCCNKGYGHFYVYDPEATGAGGRKGKSVEVRAHIASWALANGPVPADMTLDHLCVNTKCIRPSHLELVSRPENSRRQAVRRKHTRRTTTVTFPSRGAEFVKKSFPAPKEKAGKRRPNDRNLEYEHLATLQ